MTKVVCDICGKNMPRLLITVPVAQDICISSYGNTWDICTECRIDLRKWIEARKTERTVDGINNMPTQ